MPIETMPRRVPKPDFNHLKTFIEPMLQEKGFSVEQFARACGVTRAMMYFYFKDTNRPSEQVAIRMSQVLGVTAEEVLGQYTPKKVGRPAPGVN
jgi:transcriptional regulator with XRE-family HTH domain